jgi:drug/metabolite transporter (DMT)-like permease
MNRSLKADLAIFSITVIWGSSFIIMKNITDVISVYAYLTLRFSVAAVILSILFFKSLKTTTKKSAMHGSVIGLLLFLGMALQVSGLKDTSASSSAFITGLNVILVPIISAFLLRKKPPFQAIVGVCLASIGLFLLTGGLSQAWNKGDTLTLLCAVCFAFQIIFIDKFNASSDSRQLAVIQMISAAIFYGIVWLLFEPSKVVFSWPVIWTVLYTGALGTAFAFGVQTLAQQYTSPTRTALIITCEPAFGALFALLVPGTNGKTETLTMNMVFGCLLIFIGMISAEIRWKSRKIAKETSLETE